MQAENSVKPFNLEEKVAKNLDYAEAQRSGEKANEAFMLHEGDVPGSFALSYL